MMNKKITTKIVSLSLAVVLLICSMSLVSCKNKLVYEDGKYYCARTNVTYVEADFQFSPVSVNTEKYATLKENGNKIDVYAIEDVAPERWLATADGRLFCAEDEFVPTLKEFSPNRILVCKEGDKVANGIVMAIAEFSNQESISAVLKTLSNGIDVEYPTKGEATEILSLRFCSEQYSWIYYCITYVEFEKDVIITDYVTDRSTYEMREVDDTVKVTESLAFDCWYKLDEEGLKAKIKDIAEKSGIENATVTKINAEGNPEEYIGLLFSDITTVDECIDLVVEQYKGELSEEALRELLEEPDMAEKSTAVKYNYGKYLIYDRATGKCVKAPEILTNMNTQTE